MTIFVSEINKTYIDCLQDNSFDQIQPLANTAFVATSEFLHISLISRVYQPLSTTDATIS